MKRLATQALVLDHILPFLSLISGFKGRIHPGDLADLGGQHYGGLPPLPRRQRFGQPSAVLLLRQTLLGDHAEDAQALVRLALHHEDGDGKDGQRHRGR